MRPFLASKRKIIELLILLGTDIVIFFIWPNPEVIMLLSLGYIWNWTASQDLSLLLGNNRYRLSLLKTVHGLQHLILRPFKGLPNAIQVLPRILPAGLFWLLVILFTESHMPWWATFLGSFFFELTQFKSNFMHRPEKAP